MTDARRALITKTANYIVDMVNSDATYGDVEDALEAMADAIDGLRAEALAPSTDTKS